jgi:transcription elongation GreA/GreB family factor
VRAKLESVLEETTSIQDDVAPATLVTMNTTVELVNLESGAHRSVTLVYPEDSAGSGGRSDSGTVKHRTNRFQEGDVVRYPEREPACWFRVAKIVYQPERAGAWQL